MVLISRPVNSSKLKLVFYTQYQLKLSNLQFVWYSRLDHSHVLSFGAHRNISLMAYFGTFGKPTVRAHNIILIIKDITVFISILQKEKKSQKFRRRFKPLTLDLLDFIVGLRLSILKLGAYNNLNKLL